MERVTVNGKEKYRWRYDVSLFKNPTIFWLVWKIFFFIFIGIFSFVMLMDSCRSSFTADDMLKNLKILGYILLGMTIVVTLGYLLYAGIMGGKYCVIFEMDEVGILHTQTPDQAKKAKKIGKMAAMAGGASGSLSAVGVGVAAGSRTSMYSEFSKVRKIKVYRRRNLIKVNQKLNHNQIYVQDEDFDFVLQYIVSHSPNLKIPVKI